MSSSVISNSLYNLIQDVEGYYAEQKRVRPLDYTEFYTRMSIIPTNAFSANRTAVVPVKKGDIPPLMTLSAQRNLLAKFAGLCSQYEQLYKNELTMRNAQLKSLKFMNAAFTFLYVILSVALMTIAILAVKSNKGGNMIVGLRYGLAIAVIWLILTTLYGVFRNYLTYRQKEVNRTYNRAKRNMQVYFAYLNIKPELRMFMAYVKQKQGLTAAKLKLRQDSLTKQAASLGKKYTASELTDDDVVLTKRWSTEIWPILIKLHNFSNGSKMLSNIDLTSTNVKILKNVNNLLGPYYDLTLKSRQRFADASTKEGILKIIDTVVVEELRKSDIYKLNNTDDWDDETFKSRMRRGQNYQMYMAGFGYIMLYMYPAYKTVRYDKLMTYEKMLKGDTTGDKMSSLTDAEKSDYATIRTNDEIIRDLTKHFPITRANFIDELNMIDDLNNTPDGKERKAIVDDFITLSTKTFSQFYNTHNIAMIESLKTIPDKKGRNELYTKYVRMFSDYIGMLASNTVKNEVANMNPKITQYFMFDKPFMRDELAMTIFSSPYLRKFPKDYIDTMIDLFAQETLPKLQQNHIADYFDYTDTSNSQKSLRVMFVNKQIEVLVDKITTQLVAYDIKLVDYGKYITNKVIEGTRSTPSVGAAVDTIINQIDYQVNVQKGPMSRTLGDEAIAARFVAAHDFLTNLNDYKFKTLITALRVDQLKELVSALNPSDEDTQNDSFAYRMLSLQNAKHLYRMTIITIFPAYLLYALGLGQKISQDEQLKSNVQSVEGILSSDSLWSNVFKLGVPFAGAMLLIAMFSSYITKAQANIDYNRERMQENTDDIKRSVDKLQLLLSQLNADIDVEKGDQTFSSIKDIPQFDEERKKQLYQIMKDILMAYDRCNYIVGTNKYAMPFPYAEVLADGIMISLILGLLGYTLYNFAPVSRVVELKDLYEYREQAVTLVNDPTFVQEIMVRAATHSEEVKTVTFTVKAISSLSIIVFMIFYSLTIIGTKDAYKSGLYNSAYFANKACCDE